MSEKKSEEIIHGDCNCVNCRLARIESVVNNMNDILNRLLKHEREAAKGARPHR